MPQLKSENEYSRITKGIKVTAIPQYLPDQSDPGQSRYVWAYTIRIHNHGRETVKLLNRHWHITDGKGQARDVRGPGVVGEQPVLKTGQEYEYTSGVPLTTPFGIMEGEYEMAFDSGETFEVIIPPFSLDSPSGNSRPN
jgi:ApaG protein